VNRNIIYVIGSLGCGGAEKQLMMLMQGLDKSEFTPELFVLEARGALQKEVDKAGIRIYDGGYDSTARKPLKLLLLLRALWRLRRLLKTRHASIVHGFLPITNFLTSIAGRLSFIPLIVTSKRALNTHQDHVSLRRYMDKISSRLSNIITVNSEAVLEDTLRREGGSASKFAVIYNGVDVKRFVDAVQQRAFIRSSLGLRSNQVILIIVANLIPYKGHAELLDALAMLLPDYPEICLLIVGEDRGLEQRLRNQTERLGAAQSVRWLGLRDDIPELMAASDIYVCASHEEGFSNSLLEALAAGKAVVATRVGGNAEMLENGKLGLLTETNDAKGLFVAIKTLLHDSQRRHDLGKQAAQVVAIRYDPKHMVDAYLKLYRKTGA
jgi:glycosyltransferase involved in cell wall biosynthesis